MERAAEISRCGLYRYSLTRRWGTRRPFVLWIMLNPSTADANIDDPTIRRCISFSKLWEYDALMVVNLFAYRSPNPEMLSMALDPIGHENDSSIARVMREADTVVAAWGGHKLAKDRVKALVASNTFRGDMQCLGITNDGSPRHPLYVPSIQEPEHFAYENVR